MAYIRMEHFSRVLGMDMSIDVILPERRDGMSDEKLSLCDLPVMYLLHGTSDNHSAWQRQSSIERYAMKKGIAVVMPTTHIGAYTNQACGAMRYYDYVSQELPTICETFFPVTKNSEKRYIAGLSMGGYGALKIGLRNPMFYSHIIALSAGCDRLNMLPKSAHEFGSITELSAAEDKLPKQDYTRAMHFFANFGSVEKYKASYENNLFLIAEKIAEEGINAPKIFMSCGESDELALAGNRAFTSHMRNMNIPHLYDEHPGAHEWNFWDTHIKRAIEWLPSSNADII